MLSVFLKSHMFGKQHGNTFLALVFHGDVCMLHYRQPHVLDVITDALRVFKITHVRQATRKHVPSSGCGCGLLLLPTYADLEGSLAALVALLSSTGNAAKVRARSTSPCQKGF